MWRLFNLMFGWDYISWRNSADQGIARIHKAPDGTVWYWRYRMTGLLDVVNKDNSVSPWGGTIVFLTCHPSKYFD